MSQIFKLNNQSLKYLNKQILKPNYDRTLLSPGIIHIGVGNFHRAHLSWYVHRLMQRGQASDWAIIGSGVREYDSEMREKLKDQDYLTTLMELDPKGNQTCEIIGSMINYLPIQKNNLPLIEAMSDPQIRILSLTVTESGYFIDPDTGHLDFNHDEILHDIQFPDSPCTAFGAIVSALDIRRRKGHGPFTGLSCDNLIQNGDKLKQAIIGIAKKRDLDLSNWIETNCSFPNSMVDCIVPRTGDSELELAKNMGIEDSVPVTHENFRQWVIEDNFCSGRPNWEDVGVKFSSNVHGYEQQKIRILNGGHVIISNAAELLGIKTIREAMADSRIFDLLKKVEYEEIIPYVGEVPGLSPGEYFELIANRFSNPSIEDTVRRVAFDASSRHPGFIFPSIRDGLKSGNSVKGLALVEALWARMCQGIRDDGSVIENNDPIWDKLKKFADEAKLNPERWLDLKEIYGSLAKDKLFRETFVSWYNFINQHGVSETIRKYLKKS